MGATGNSGRTRSAPQYRRSSLCHPVVHVKPSCAEPTMRIALGPIFSCLAHPPFSGVPRDIDNSHAEEYKHHKNSVNVYTQR